MILLDTCTLLWLVSGSNRLPESARNTLAKARGQIYVSAISGFEIGLKCSKGKLGLPLPPEQWFPEALAFHGLHEVPITSTIAVRSTQLENHHADPADRMIVATAADRGLTVLTPDPLIAKYVEAKITWA